MNIAAVYYIIIDILRVSEYKRISNLLFCIYSEYQNINISAVCYLL